MTRRVIIFKDYSTGMMYATEEFNGDKTEFEKFHMRDTCDADWDEIIECFNGVTTLTEFKKANKKAQQYYHSSICPEQEILPVYNINNYKEPVADEVYIIKEDGTIKLVTK